MIKYLKKVFAAFPEKITSAAMILEDESRLSPQECVGRDIPSMCAWQVAAVAV